ncbi:MAG: MnmC family methyltransferase [Pirellula sp.]
MSVDNKHALRVFIAKGLFKKNAEAFIFADHITHRGFIDDKSTCDRNAFLAYLFAITSEKEIRYTGIEAYPIDSAIAQKLNYPQYLAFPEEQDIFLRMHMEQTLSSDSFHFKKLSAYDQIPAHEKFDCIFFDAFAPGAQPELWEQTVFDHLFTLTSEGGYLVTYCAQGEARRRMEKAGYKVERIPGPPGKREMLRAVRE